MRKKLTEETVIFISILKWFVLATAIGAIVGFATAVFLKLLSWGTTSAMKQPNYFLLLPLGLFASSLLTKYLAPDAEGHGTEKVIEAVHKNYGKIPVLVVPVKLAATLITLISGGSAGKEGPCAQIGAGLSSLFADIFRFDNRDRMKLVICGISAGFASVFGTPIAGAIFGVEVLFVGSLMYDVLLPSFIAGVTAYQVSSALGINYFYHALSFKPVFSELFFIKVAFAGVFFGLCSFLFVEMLRFGETVSKNIKIWAPLKGFIGGFSLIAFTLVFSGNYLGLGLDTIESCLQGGATAWYAFLVKILFTVTTLTFGGSGGIVTPIFFVGATSGSALAHLMNLDAATFSAIGLVSLLAGAANTPIAASIMAVELFGPAVAPYAAVACVISFLMTGHRSVYPSQVLSVKKTTSVDVEVGRVMEDLNVNIKPRKRSVTGLLLKLFKKL